MSVRHVDALVPAHIERLAAQRPLMILTEAGWSIWQAAQLDYLRWCYRQQRMPDGEAP